MKIAYTLVLFAALGVVGCQKPEREKTQLDIRITDAPGNFQSVFLNIREIIVKSEDGDKTLTVANKPFDILNYTFGKDTLLSSASIPSGKISQIRLVLHEEGNFVIVDNVKHDLKTPSGQQSGIKLKINDVLISGEKAELNLDFDVAKSIVLTGSGKYTLKPVIRSFVKSMSGAICGDINPDDAFSQVFAINATSDTVGTISLKKGKFYIQGLEPGDYSLLIQPSAGYSAKTIPNITVSAGKVRDLGQITVQ
ncbi:MAG TPA: DUF4382 domain-containing protein [Cytophagaceae bacterium]|jgi:hypothetical protein